MPIGSISSPTYKIGVSYECLMQLCSTNACVRDVKIYFEEEGHTSIHIFLLIFTYLCLTISSVLFTSTKICSTRIQMGP